MEQRARKIILRAQHMRTKLGLAGDISGWDSTSWDPVTATASRDSVQLWMLTMTSESKTKPGVSKEDLLSFSSMASMGESESSSTNLVVIRARIIKLMESYMHAGSRSWTSRRCLGFGCSPKSKV